MLRRQQRAHVGAAFDELMYGAREHAFRSRETAQSAAGPELLMASPFDAAAEEHDGG